MDKPQSPDLQVVSVCPSCGIASPDSPHRTSDQCIRALEAEIERLAALLDRVKESRAAQRRKK